MSSILNLNLLFTGIIIGLAVAAIGGFVEYWFSLRTNGNMAQRRLPGCLLYAAGGLALAGIISILGSFLFNGGIAPALVLGAGVLTGFYAGFIFLFILWLLIEKFEKSVD